MFTALRIAIIILIISVITGLTLLWLGFNQSSPYSDHELIFLSNQLKRDIDSVVERRKDIAAIHVVTVKFQKNIRLETFISISNPAIQLLYDNFITNKLIETPLFDSDKNNNSKLLRLMNGEFVCVPYELSSAYRHAPSASTFIKTVCGIGIPPNNYSDFVGILTIYLSETPSKDTVDELYLYARELSVKINDGNKNSYANRVKPGVGIH